jgi:hypothetical protein
VGGVWVVVGGGGGGESCGMMVLVGGMFRKCSWIDAGG